MLHKETHHREAFWADAFWLVAFVLMFQMFVLAIVCGGWEKRHAPPTPPPITNASLNTSSIGGIWLGPETKSSR
jgi:hypothetical protein